jgi:hypothetical protein
MNTLPPSIRALCNRFKSNVGLTRRGAYERHDLSSLGSRVLLSRAEVLEQVGNGNLIALDGPLNGKYLFSSSSLDSLRNRVIDFVAGEIATELHARGIDSERIEMAVCRGLSRQHQLSRSNSEAIISLARTPSNQDDDDDDDHTLRNAAALAGGIGAGYVGTGLVKRAWQNRGNGNGTTLPDGSPQPQLPGGPSGDSQGGRHPGPPGSGGASLPVPITTASSTMPKLTAGSGIIDPLSQAVANGRKAIAKKGSAIWRALRSIPIE